MSFRLLDLFSGIGGFSLAASWVWGPELEIAAFVEIDPFCRKVLAKHWPDVPQIKDVRDVGGKQFGPIDLLTGGFPCQDISHCGKEAGLSGEKSSSWKELQRLIGEARPRFALVENVPNLLAGNHGQWFCEVLGDLAQIGYNAEWHCIPASRFGAPHQRDRLWIIAHPNTQEGGCNTIKAIFTEDFMPRRNSSKTWRSPVPDISRVDDGLPNRMDRLGALGNSIVPQVAAQIMLAIKAADEAIR
jgi:DNA (cytosine-5)-methyltransferase 1